jgi:hypothetical protein
VVQCAPDRSSTSQTKQAAFPLTTIIGWGLYKYPRPIEREMCPWAISISVLVIRFQHKCVELLYDK